MADTKTVPALNSVRNQNLRVRPRSETLLNPLGHLIDAGGIEPECGESMKPVPPATPYISRPTLILVYRGLSAGFRSPSHDQIIWTELKQYEIIRN